MDQTQAIKFWHERIRQLDEKIEENRTEHRALKARRRKAERNKKAVEDELGAFPEIVMEESA